MPPFPARCAGFLLAFFLFAFFPPFQVRTAAQSSVQNSGARTVRVAVYNNSVYGFRDKSGIWRGIDIECMTNISIRAGFKVEFIDSTLDPDFLGSLDRGVYDIVADVVKNPAREARYLFGENEQGSSSATLAVRADDERWEFGNVNQLSHMTVGLVRSNANSGEFSVWCRAHGVSPAIRYFPDIPEMSRALRSGAIDGEVYGVLYGREIQNNPRTIMQFLPRPYYYVFRRDDRDLKNSVDEAMAQILVENPYYLSDLKNKYFSQLSTRMLPFSSAEKRYIASHPAIRVAVLRDDAPYYSRTARGAEKGILPDYLTLISSASGLKVSYSVCDTQKEAVEAVRQGRAEVLGIFSGGIIAAAQDGLALTESFSPTNTVLIAHMGRDIGQIRTVAVEQRSSETVQSLVEGGISKAEFIGCNTAPECFHALRAGRTDAIICSLPSASWILNQTNASQFSLTPLPGVTLELCGAVAADNRILCGILNKCIAGTKGSFGGIVTHDTVEEGSWISFISRIPPASIAIVTALLFALVLALILALLALRRRQNERAAVLAVQAETERERIQVEAMQRTAEERNQFFSNISHDMRTPLNAIIGFSNLAESRAVSPELRSYLAKIRLSGNLLLGLVNDTLTISKMRNGKLELSPEAVSTDEITQTIVASIGPNAEKKGIVFAVDDSGLRPRYILADKLNLQKIFLNLLSNAVKFTPPGGHVWYTLKDEPAGAADPDIAITVRDDGIGMSQEYQSRLYEPFTQERRSGYESMGTGLGLSIVKQLVDLMGGSIEVSSQMNRGTAFTVRLHFSEAGAPAEGSPASAGAPREKLRGRKILLCEDNQLNQEIASALLKDAGMTVVVAANGREGLDMLAESPVGDFCAVLMDLRMPVMDGYEAAQRMRALPRPDVAALPIIAMTADAFEDDVQKCISAGMNGHIAKPIDIDQMLALISTAIG